MKQEHKDIICTPLEDIMHDSIMVYSEYITLERALPRVEDGLKPVQRRILYAMNEMQIYPDSKHKKCARIVGETMGKFHPHGDTSIYDALARMAQDFSMGAPLIDGQGNFGSIDGDSPAAMRYTEARLAPIAMEMLSEIEKECVPFSLNFDDTLKEPRVLPCRYPNLLVNGSTGIAIGMATNIPPHSLSEVIDGTVARMSAPDSSLDDIMRHIKAPDFPTGGVLHGLDELRQAYETGKGKITLRAKVDIEYTKTGKPLIVISELPYEVKESNMLRKIEALREQKKDMFAGIDSVRSETDRTGIRAVIELKKGVDEQKMLDRLYKYSDMQITYGMNMLAIVDGQPKQVGLLQMLDAYIAFQRDVKKKCLKYDMEQAMEREHRLAGLIIAVSNIDLVIKIIRASENTKEAKKRLLEQVFVCRQATQLSEDVVREQAVGRDMYKLTPTQAQAILDMRLAKLTRLEIDALMREYAELVEFIMKIRAILASPALLDGEIVKDLKRVKKHYSVPRRTKISRESAEIVIDQEEFRVKEECAVIYTNGGNIKRMTMKALARGAEGADIEEKNRPKKVLQTDTDSRIQFFTESGNLYTAPVSAVREAKYKDAGNTIHAVLAGVEKGEKILDVMLPTEKGRLLTVSEQGMVRLCDMAELAVKKSKVVYAGLKEKDRILLAEPDDADRKYILLVTRMGMSIRFPKEEISVQGRTAKGVGGINLAKGDEVIFAAQTAEEGNVFTFSNAGFAKQTPVSEYEIQGRNGKGLKTFFWMKNAANGNKLAAAYFSENPAAFRMVTRAGSVKEMVSADIPTEARYSRGEQLVPAMLGDELTDVSVK